MGFGGKGAILPRRRVLSRMVRVPILGKFGRINGGRWSQKRHLKCTSNQFISEKHRKHTHRLRLEICCLAERIYHYNSDNTTSLYRFLGYLPVRKEQRCMIHNILEDIYQTRHFRISLPDEIDYQSNSYFSKANTPSLASQLASV